MIVFFEGITRDNLLGRLDEIITCYTKVNYWLTRRITLVLITLDKLRCCEHRMEDFLISSDCMSFGMGYKTIIRVSKREAFDEPLDSFEVRTMNDLEWFLERENKTLIKRDDLTGLVLFLMELCDK